MGFSARISLVSILTIATTFELVLNRVAQDSLSGKRLDEIEVS